MSREERRAARMARRVQRQVVEVDEIEEGEKPVTPPPPRRSEVVPEPEIEDDEDAETELEEVTEEVETDNGIEVEDEETELEEVTEEVEESPKQRPVKPAKVTLESLARRVAELEKIFLDAFKRVKHSGKVTGRLPKDFWENLYSNEFKKWRDNWQQMTYEEKVAYARAKGITWDEHSTERVDHMRVGDAVRDAEVASKYKPEYADRQARAEAKTKAMAGLPY